MNPAVSSSAVPLPNWDALQRGYNILYLDPTTLGQGNSSNSGVCNYVLQMQANTPCPGSDSFLMPAECNSDLDHKFVENTSDDTTIVQATSDIVDSLSASISVGDPTGQLYAFGASTATQQRRQQISGGTTVTSTTNATYQVYSLSIPNWNEATGKTGVPQLTTAFTTAVKNLTSAADVATTIIPNFGTHFSWSMVFGGIATLNLTLTQSNVSLLTAQNVSLQAQGSASFDVIKAGGSIGSSSNVNDTYAAAVKNQTQEIVATGGTFTTLDDWEQSLLTAPVPIAVQLQPLYALPQLETAVGAAQLGYLTQGINGYLQQGVALSQSILNYGDTIVLQPVNGLTPTGTQLLSPQPGLTGQTPPSAGVGSTIASPQTPQDRLLDVAPGGMQLDAALDGLQPVVGGYTTPFLLTLVNPDNAADQSLVDCTKPIRFALYNASPAWYLDSEAGGGSNQGNVGLRQTSDPEPTTTEWMIYPLYAPNQPVAATQTLYATLAHEQGVFTDTNSVVHGDAVSIWRLEASNPNPANKQGFLQATSSGVVSRGNYQLSAVAGNSCFFRMLLVFKTPNPTAV
jgi:hypothetical protein